MSTQAQTRTVTPFRIHPATRMGHLSLTVADLDRQVGFYREVLGFKEHWREDGPAGLGAGGEDLLRLTERRGARRVRRTTGLYHFALRVPSRWELAQLLRRIAETPTTIHGMVDHHTHLAIYLPDAEGNGIELAWDFPHERWPKDLADMIRLGNAPLEPEELFEELQPDPSPWAGLDARSDIGHVHLHVADLHRAEAFYHGVLGFDIPFGTAAPVSPQIGASFLSAGGYHHHLGVNVWQGKGAPPPPPDSLGLRYFSVILPDREALEAVLERVRQAGVAMETTAQGVLLRDPSRNGVMLSSGAGDG